MFVPFRNFSAPTFAGALAGLSALAVDGYAGLIIRSVVRPGKAHDHHAVVDPVNLVRSFAMPYKDAASGFNEPPDFCSSVGHKLDMGDALPMRCRVCKRTGRAFC
jgi:hypothetical protein